jgi:hypothetical protein
MNRMKHWCYTLLFSLSIWPDTVFAHGTETEHQKEIMTNTYVLIGTGILFILFFVLYWVTRNKVKTLSNVKKSEDREKRQQLAKSVNRLKWAWILSLAGVLISGGMALFSGTSSETAITLEDIHGLGYTSDGKQIVIPSHYGLRVFSGGEWEIPEGERNGHDYMGFAMADNGFYSSGHPAKGSDLVNPFGVIKSTDGGKDLRTLDLKGESDFHSMTASYNTHTIYVLNTGTNSRMDSPGLYYTKDEAKTWVKSKMNGIQDESIYEHMALVPVAVHPTKDNVVAVGTKSGAYVSTDYGDNFEKLFPDTQITALFFNNKGILYVGAYKNEPLLTEMNIETKNTKELSLPTLTKDAVAYIAENPVDATEMVFATFNKDVYVSNDQGENWIKIADQGKGISKPKD